MSFYIYANFYGIGIAMYILYILFFSHNKSCCYAILLNKTHADLLCSARN